MRTKKKTVKYSAILIGIILIASTTSANETQIGSGLTFLQEGTDTNINIQENIVVDKLAPRNSYTNIDNANFSAKTNITSDMDIGLEHFNKEASNSQYLANFSATPSKKNVEANFTFSNLNNNDHYKVYRNGNIYYSEYPSNGVFWFTNDEWSTQDFTIQQENHEQPNVTIKYPLTGDDYGIGPIDVDFKAEVETAEETTEVRFKLSDDSGDYNDKTIYSTTQDNQTTINHTHTENLEIDNYTWYVETETDFHGNLTTNTESFEVLPAGTINVVMEEPNSSIIIEQGETFNMSGYIECLNGICAEQGDQIEVWADPIETDGPVKVDTINEPLKEGGTVDFDVDNVQKKISGKISEDDLDIRVKDVDLSNSSQGIIGSITNKFTVLVTNIFEVFKIW